jgi:hypothetical protein
VTVKACVGLFDRQGNKGGGTLSNPVSSTYYPILGGFVVTSASSDGISWADLQPTQGGAIVRGNTIDQALTLVRSINAGQTRQWTLKLRLFTGELAPSWAKALGGGPISTGGSTIGAYWTPAYQQAWQDFHTALAAIYDGVVEIGEVVEDIGADLGAEPLLHAGFTAAGYTAALEMQAHQSALSHMRTVWTQTPVSLAFNPYVNPTTNVVDVAFTETLIDFLATSIEPPFGVLENNSLRANGLVYSPYADPHSPNYTAMYKRIASHGKGQARIDLGYPAPAHPSPICIQTSTLGGMGGSTAALQATLDYAVWLGARMIELPSTYWTVASTALLDSYNPALLTNDVARGGTSPRLTGVSYNAVAHTLTLTGTGLDAVPNTADEGYGSGPAGFLDIWTGLETIPSARGRSDAGYNISTTPTFINIVTQSPTMLILDVNAIDQYWRGVMAVSLALGTMNPGPSGDTQTWTDEVGYPLVTFPGLDVTADPWWNHFSDPIAGTPWPQQLTVVPSVLTARYDATTQRLTLTGAGFATRATWTINAWGGDEAVPATVGGGDAGAAASSVMVVNDNLIVVEGVTTFAQGFHGTMAIAIVGGGHEYGYALATFPGAEISSDPWWNHFSNPILGTVGSLSLPSPVVTSGLLTTAGRLWLADALGNSRRPPPCLYVGLSADATALDPNDSILTGEVARVLGLYDYPPGAEFFLVHGTYTAPSVVDIRKFALFADAVGGKPLIEFLDAGAHQFARGIQATFTLLVPI